MNHLLASAATDERGAFSFTLPDDYSELVVVAKLQGPVLAVIARTFDLKAEGPGPHTIRVDSTSNQFHTVRGQIFSTEGGPPYLLLHFDPVHLAGVPAPLEKFFNEIDEQITEAWFYQERLVGANFEIRVQDGSYRIETHYFNKSRAELPGRPGHNYAMAWFAADGGQAAQFESEFSSFVLQADRDRNVHITISPVKSEELN
jgi:hypothetical protein